ncbi:Ppx/GppA family phosphatase [Novosphingobium profundi]|uniref:Ppx/GppA family phosphatase n=1 Tax=Novosphingobium profundi TaxID=1774954 RepID=UPI001BDA2AE8|nr:Ppx/GppA family phosphatase [Novosphingobium profundi]MBT0669390.1 Ppx/GppA family phosphatase [Novosphingobium profundi]
MIGISHSNEKRAIIDIGSNTVRLVIYNGPLRAPVVMLNEKVNARLGRDLDRDGTLSEKALKTALGALARFARLLALHRVRDVDCVATAAARDASNGPQFLDAVRAFGLSPRLLSGDEEARASANAVLAAFPGAHGTVADLGGGSLELIGVENGEIARHGITMPFGTLRLPELRREGAATFAALVRGRIEADTWRTAQGEPLYIVGGSWRALALQAMRELQWPVDDPHGFTLSAEEVISGARRFARGKIEDPDPRISSSRLASLPDAAALLGEVVKVLQPSEVVFSSWGLREGLLYAQLEPQVQAEPPMLASVAGFALAARVSAEEAVSVADWTAPVCDDDDGRDRDLRQASTLLALAAMRTEPNLRTEEATTWALRKRWIGLDMRGRGMMAMTVFASAGLSGTPDPFPRLASREDLDHAIGWGLAIRLCRRLHGGCLSALGLTRLAATPERITLHLGERALPLYNASAAKDLKALAEWLGREWNVVGPDGTAITP